MTLKRMGWIAAALLSTPLIGAAQNTAKPVLTGLEHVSLSVYDADAEMRFLGKLGFEQALSDQAQYVPSHRSGIGILTRAYVKINDSQFIEFTVPDIHSAAQTQTAYGFLGLCFLTPNVSLAYEHWDLAGLKPKQVYVDKDRTLRIEADNPEIIAHDPGADHVAAVQYKKGGSGSEQVRETGQHLGANRISDLLIGVEMPVDNVPLWQKYFEKMGFAASSQGAKVRMTYPGNPDMEIVLRLAGAYETYLNATRFLFSVEDVTIAKEQLRDEELNVETGENEVTVHDPDGNAFVFMQREVPLATK